MTEWSEIVRQHGSVVWKTAYRLLGNECDAADCFQETFVAAMKSDQRERVRNWHGLLKRIATARALDRLRQRSRENSQWVQVADTSQLIGHDTSPEQESHQAELIERLLNAVGKLPPQQSEVVCLFYLESQTYGQIANALGISVSHVGVLLHRAKASLRELFAEHQLLPSTESTRHAKDE